MEEYKLIPGYEDYGVSRTGKVYSLKFNKPFEKAAAVQKNGYINIDLMRNAKRKHFLVHRLVGLLYIPNPDNLPEIHHKDGNRSNNNVENLEWCTRKHNLAESYKTLSPTRNFSPCNLVNNETNEIIKAFKTKSEASEYAKETFGCSAGYLMKCKVSNGYRIELKV